MPTVTPKFYKAAQSMLETIRTEYPPSISFEQAMDEVVAASEYVIYYHTAQRFVADQLTPAQHANAECDVREYTNMAEFNYCEFATLIAGQALKNQILEQAREALDI
tara:strand:+ start:235 stop:555 length:321 start_codon:yes stop_codon:yes gene_type:complete